MAYSLFCFVFHLRTQNTSCYLVCVWPTNEQLVRSQDELNYSRKALLQLLFKFTWKATKKKKKREETKKKNTNLICKHLNLGFKFLGILLLPVYSVFHIIFL